MALCLALLLTPAGHLQAVRGAACAICCDHLIADIFSYGAARLLSSTSAFSASRRSCRTCFSCLRYLLPPYCLPHPRISPHRRSEMPLSTCYRNSLEGAAYRPLERRPRISLGEASRRITLFPVADACTGAYHLYRDVVEPHAHSIYALAIDACLSHGSFITRALRSLARTALTRRCTAYTRAYAVSYTASSEILRLFAQRCRLIRRRKRLAISIARAAALLREEGTAREKARLSYHL